MNREIDDVMRAFEKRKQERKIEQKAKKTNIRNGWRWRWEYVTAIKELE